jgi:hypothetical protein
VPAPDEIMAEQRVRDGLFDRYRYLSSQDIVDITVSLLEEIELEEEVRY